MQKEILIFVKLFWPVILTLLPLMSYNSAQRDILCHHFLVDFPKASSFPMVWLFSMLSIMTALKYRRKMHSTARDLLDF